MRFVKADFGDGIVVRSSDSRHYTHAWGTHKSAQFSSSAELARKAMTYGAVVPVVEITSKEYRDILNARKAVAA